jgi:hypothetical protein
MEFQAFKNLDLRTWEIWWRNSESGTCALADRWQKNSELSYVRLLFADHTGNTWELRCKQTPDTVTVTELVFSYYLDFHLFKNLFPLDLYFCVYMCNSLFMALSVFWITFDHLFLKYVGDPLDKTQSGINKVSRSVSKYNLNKTYE